MLLPDSDPDLYKKILDAEESYLATNLDVPTRIKKERGYFTSTSISPSPFFAVGEVGSGAFIFAYSAVTGSRWWKNKGVPEGFGRPECVHEPTSLMKLFHSFAHELQTDNTELHGASFIKSYLDLVERFVSKEQRHEFKGILAKNGVPIRMWSDESRANASAKYRSRRTKKEIQRTLDRISRLEHH